MFPCEATTRVVDDSYYRCFLLSRQRIFFRVGGRYEERALFVSPAINILVSKTFYNKEFLYVSHFPWGSCNSN